MENLGNPLINNNLVNYTSVLTQAANENFFVNAATSDSFSSLMRNTIYIQFSLPPKIDGDSSKDKEDSESRLVF